MVKKIERKKEYEVERDTKRKVGKSAGKER